VADHVWCRWRRASVPRRRASSWCHPGGCV
jgi:hypothetical protein